MLKETQKKVEKRSYLDNDYDSDNMFNPPHGLPPIWQQDTNTNEKWPNDEKIYTEPKKLIADSSIKIKLCTKSASGCGEICIEIKKTII